MVVNSWQKDHASPTGSNIQSFTVSALDDDGLAKIEFWTTVEYYGDPEEYEVQIIPRRACPVCGWRTFEVKWTLIDPETPEDGGYYEVMCKGCCTYTSCPEWSDPPVS